MINRKGQCKLYMYIFAYFKYMNIFSNIGANSSYDHVYIDKLFAIIIHSKRWRITRQYITFFFSAAQQ